MKKSRLWSILTTFIACASVTNAQNGVSLPYSCDFETEATEWSFANSAVSSNHWYRGNGAVGNSTYCLYISSNNGLSNIYEDCSQKNYSHAYLPVNIETAGEYILNFSYSSQGEFSYDAMHVALLDEVPVADQEIASENEYSGQLEWTTTNITFQVTTPGTKYLVFSWFNDFITTNQAPAIDDILFQALTCPAPENLQIEQNGSNYDISWETSASTSLLYYKTEAAESWTETPVSSTSHSLSGLEAGTTYMIRARAVCGEGDTSIYSDTKEFSTACLPFSFPYLEDFSSYEINSLADCWLLGNQNGIGWQIDEDFYENRNNLAYYGDEGEHCNLYSPTIDITSCDRSRLELVLTYASMGGSNVVSLFLSTDNGASWDSIEADPLVSMSMTTINIPLGELVGDAGSLQFMFKGKGELYHSYYGFHIYNFNIQHSPICFPPTNIVMEEVEANRSLISWTAPEEGDPQYYELTWYKEGGSENPASGQTEGLENQKELLDLEQNTTYVVELSTMCSTEGSVDTVFTFHTAYSCPAPTNMLLTSTSANSLGFSWEGSGGPFEVSYKEASASEWILYDVVEENEILIEGLSDGNTYDARVRIICGENDSSLYARLSGTTQCLPKTLPYDEDFETADAGLMPPCWTWQWVSQTAAFNPWEIDEIYVKEGEASLRFNSGYLPEEYFSIAVSPIFEFDKAQNYELEFWILRDNRAIAYDLQKEGIKIFAGPTTDTADAQLVTYIHNNTNLSPVETSVAEDDWYHYSIKLPSLEGNNYLLFYGIPEYSYSMFIDDLHIKAVEITTINKSLEASICAGDTYMFGGTALRESGIYHDTIASSTADTIVTLTLTVNPSYRFELDTMICEGSSVVFGGKTYTEAGEYIENYPTRNGCDSIYHLLLGIHPSYRFELDTAICEGSSVVFGGKTYTEEGEYLENYPTRNGCDSIYHLVLAFHPSYSFELDTAICEGNSIVFGGKTYTEEGEYLENYPTRNGCDSIYHLVLAVNPLPEPPVIEMMDPDTWEIPSYLRAITEEDSVRWYLNDNWIEEAYSKQYTPVEIGTYHATAVNGCGESEPSNKIEVTYIADVEGSSLAEAPAVYPNPASDNVYIRARQNILLAQIYAQSGKLVTTIEGNDSPEMTLPVSPLAAGTYILKVQTAAGWFTYKVVKH